MLIVLCPDSRLQCSTSLCRYCGSGLFWSRRGSTVKFYGFSRSFGKCKCFDCILLLEFKGTSQRSKILIEQFLEPRHRKCRFGCNLSRNLQGLIKQVFF